jgi:hypothetical protein
LSIWSASSSLVVKGWGSSTTRAPRIADVGPGTEEHENARTRSLKRTRRQYLKHRFKKKEALPLVQPVIPAWDEICLAWNPWEWRCRGILRIARASSVRKPPKRAEASSNVRWINPKLCSSRSVPGRRVQAHISHRCPSANFISSPQRVNVDDSCQTYSDITYAYHGTLGRDVEQEGWISKQNPPGLS